MPVFLSFAALIPFQKILETFPGPVWVQDSGGHLHWCNDTWYRYTGKEMDAVVSYSEFVHPEDRDQLLLTLIEAARVGSWSYSQARIRQGSGSYHWFLVHFGYFIQGQQSYWLGLAMDMGSGPRYEEARRRKILEMAMDGSEMGIWEWNMITGEISWSERHSEILGLGRQAGSWEFDYFLGLVHPEDRGMLLEKINHSLSHGDRWQAECRVIRADGNEYWMDIHGMVADRPNLRELHMVGSSADITSRRARELQWEEIIGIAGHELRTPITSIKSYSQLLRVQLAGAGETDEGRIVDRLVDQSDRLSGLVSNLLDATRFAGRQPALSYEWFDLDELVAHCIEAVKTMDLLRPILFPDRQGGRIFADQERIRQVCLNLLGNALKYSASGSPVTVRTWQAEEMVGFSVEDKGIGIPKEMKEKIFDKFVQVDQRTPAGGSGLGLGLYISAGIIRGHGGQIGVETTVGEGSMFYFTIPVTPR